jgi:MFS family permease
MMDSATRAAAAGSSIRSELAREWIVPFIFFMLLITVDQADYNAVGPITGLIRTEFGLSATEVGLYAGIGALFGLLALIPTGEIIKRFGLRIAGTVTPLTVVVGAVVSLLAPSFLVLILGRAALNAGFRSTTLTGQAGGASVAPPRIMGTLWAFLNTALVVGGVIGSVWLGGFVGANYGWRAVFVVEATVTVVVAIVFVLFLPRAQAGRATDEIEVNPPVSFDAYRSVPVWLLGLGAGLATSGSTMIVAFGAIVVADQWALGPQFIGDSIGLGYLLSLPLMFVLAVTVDRTGRRRLALTTAALVGLVGALIAVGAVSATTTGGPEMFRIAIALFVSCSVSALALFFAAAPMFVPRGASLGPVYGLIATLALTWPVILPIVAGAVRDATGSFAIAFGLIAICELGAVVIVRRMHFPALPAP